MFHSQLAVPAARVAANMRAMDGMFLPEVEKSFMPGPRGDEMRAAKAAGAPLPQILHLFAFKPDRTTHLGAFTHEVMRGPSPLSAGQRELIAAFTSGRNHCLF
jgi:alkylhydroperoxidase family enzyme